MSLFNEITDRALTLASQAGTSLKHAAPNAGKLLSTGAALGAAKTGGRVAVAFVRRNPVLGIATALGVGVLAYAAHRRRKREEANAPIEGKSKRIEARRVNGNGSAKARKSTASASTRSSARARKTTSPSAEA
ncbi:MAG: hypothetical protein EOP91_05310 [Lysobacteraceae bacterium]|nr:MAG: hypothetical protein EOP91_05310 [Xanthomonadaceae bacterium]